MSFGAPSNSDCMNPLRLTLLLGLAAAVSGVRGETDHVRPTWALGAKHTDDAGRVTAWSALGPLLFAKRAPDGGTTSGLRPLWVQTTGPNGGFREALFLYPIFTYEADAETYRWSFFELVNRAGRKAGAPPPRSMLEDGEAFDVWPFWFSRRTSDPETSYRALFPIAGTIDHRLGYDRLHWVLWPLYFQTESRGAVTTQTPWPIVRVTRGEAHGFALWPLFGWQTRPGESHEEFYLWPLGYNNTKQPADDAPPGTPPRREIGALPFYSRSSGPGLIDENYLWPFFGYTDRTEPSRYHETRYLWPFFVQGRGEDHLVDRWAPFYTHSIVKGYDKTWYLWPLYRHASWVDEGLAQTKTQVLWALYWSQEQRSPTNPRLAPASVTHVWPLFSAWDNGAGRRQIQALSPFEVFFQGNEKVREVWTPLFALYRYDQRAPGDEHYSLLWDIVTWERHAPPASAQNAPAGRRIALGRGLVGVERAPGEHAWRLFWLDFRSKAATSSVGSR